MPIHVTVTWKVVSSALASLASLVGLTVYATWEIRKDYVEDLKNQVAVYTQAQSWKLPETLKSLNEISEKLQAQFTSEAELKKLKLEKAGDEASLSILNSQLASSADKNEELTATVSDLQRKLQKSVTPANQFVLKPGQSFELAKNQTAFGLVNLYTNSVQGTLDGQRVSVDLTGTLGVKVNGDTCSLRLTQINFETATFSFVCPSNAE